MLHPSQLTASPRAHLFDHQLFAHGRLFHRYHGSEACRFSPSAAFRLLAHLARQADGQSTLWDPFCGTGFILAVGAYFFPQAFPTIVASDVDAESVACALRNLALFTDRAAFDARLREMELNGRPNPRSRERWSEVSVYFERLGAALDFAQPAFVAEGFVGSAAEAVRTDTRLTIVGDLPYGRASLLAGASYTDVLRPLLDRHPQTRALFIAPAQAGEDLRLLALATGRALHLRAFKGGRVGARFAPRSASPSSDDAADASADGAAEREDIDELALV